MTRKERMLAAIDHEGVDRMPFATYNLHPCVGSVHAGDASYAPLLDLVVEKAGMLCKAAAVKDPLRQCELYLPQMATLRDETAGQTVMTRILPTPRGDLRSTIVKPANQPVYVTEHFVKTDADVERLMSLALEPAEPDISQAVEIGRELGERGLVYVRYPDPMNAAAVMFDFQDFAVRCFTDLPAVLRVVDRVFDIVREQVRRLAKACRGYDFLLHTGGPEKATPPMMPPELFAQLVTPYEKKLVQLFHDEGLRVALHCHGRVRLVLDEIMECGFDVLEPIEPPPQGDITLAELMEKSAGRLTLMGNIQDQDLHTAPPGHFTKVIEQIAAVADRRTGFICTPTATPFQFPATDTFVRNYTEWIEAAARHFA